MLTLTQRPITIHNTQMHRLLLLFINIKHSFRVVALWLVCIASLFVSPAFAKRDAVIEKAAQLLREEQPQKAFDLLAPLELERAGDPDFDLALGISANQTQRYTLAIMALERVVQIQPKNARAKTELAGVYYAVRDYERAKKLFEGAKAIGVPTQVGKQIDQFVSTIDDIPTEQKPKPFRFGHSVHFTVGHDSNVNRAPSQNTFKIPGYDAPLPLTEEGQKIKSAYATLGYTASASYAFNQNWSWTGSANINARANKRTKRLNTNTVSISTGGSYSKERHQLNLLLHTSLQSLHSKKAVTTYGISGSWTYHLDGFRQITSDIGYFTDQNHINRYNDSRKLNVDFAYSHMLRTGTVLFSGLHFSTDKPKDKHFADKQTNAWGVRGGVQHPIRKNLSLSARLNYQNRAYSRLDPTFAKKRNDQEYRFETSLSWTPRRNLIVSPAYGIGQSKSNIDFYSFKRSYYSVSTRYIF